MTTNNSPKKEQMLSVPNEVSVKNSVSRNIVVLALFRGGNVGIQLLLVPISINFISAEFYGLWLTLSSMITWLNIMDFGLSNGLRNKLSISRLEGNVVLGRRYVSTTYGILFIIALIGTGLLTGISYFLDWRSILDIPDNFTINSLLTLILIVISSFFLTFLLKPINAVAYSFHLAYVEPMISFASSALNLALLYSFSIVNPDGGIIELALIFCFTPILVHLLITVVLFSDKFAMYSPSLRFFDISKAKPLMSLSSKFFIIQVAASVVLTTTNFIISHYFGNKAVTEYNVVQRYFSAVLILQGMILTPFWNLITEAYTSRKADWLRAVMKKLTLMTTGFALLIVILIFISPFVLPMWIGNSLHISRSMTIAVGIYTIVFIYASLFTTFINGTGKVKLQMTTSVFTCLFYIPFVIVLIKTFDIGVLGVVVAGTVWTLVILPLRFLQYRKLVAFSNVRSIWTS